MSMYKLRHRDDVIKGKGNFPSKFLTSIDGDAIKFLGNDFMCTFYMTKSVVFLCISALEIRKLLN